ncbi:MAG: hypothetical protein OHK0029_35990 [Armatimonadaceae bacterium]
MQRASELNRMTGRAFFDDPDPNDFSRANERRITNIFYGKMFVESVHDEAKDAACHHPLWSENFY